MAVYTVSVAKNINIAPETVTEEIIQNIQIILSTAKGTVPLDRDFGIDWTMLDEPTPMAMMLARTEIIDAIEEYEPRAKVKSITFKKDVDLARDGGLIPIVTVEINNE